MGLSLTLRKGESVDIGDASVFIAYASSSRVQLVITAPKEIQILREKAKVRCPKKTADSLTKEEKAI